MSCAICGMLNNNQAEPTVLYCRVTEHIRYQLWYRLIREFGFEVLSQLTSLEPKEQLLSFFSFLKDILVEQEKVNRSQSIILTSLNYMAIFVSFKYCL